MKRERKSSPRKNVGATRRKAVARPVWNLLADQIFLRRNREKTTESGGAGRKKLFILQKGERPISVEEKRTPP